MPPPQPVTGQMYRRDRQGLQKGQQEGPREAAPTC